MREIGSVAAPRSGTPAAGSEQQSSADVVPGAVVRVRTEGPAGDGRTWVRIAGKLFRAEWSGQPPPGLSVRARVLRVGPPLVLRVVSSVQDHPPSPEVGRSWARLVRGLLPELSALAGERPEARVLVGLLDLPDTAEALARALWNWIRAAGPWRSDAHDRGSASPLGTLLARLAAGLPEGEVQEGLLRLLERLDGYRTAGQAEPLAVIPFVLPWGGDWIPGELGVVPDAHRRGGGQPRADAVRVRIEFPNLGVVEVWVSRSHRGTVVRIGAAPHACRFIRPRLGVLRRALGALECLGPVCVRVEPLRPGALGVGSGVLEVTA